MNRISKAVAILSLFSLASMDAVRTGQRKAPRNLATLGAAASAAGGSALAGQNQAQPSRLNRLATATRKLAQDLREYADCRPNCSAKLMASIKRNKKKIAATVLAVGAVAGYGAYRYRQGKAPGQPPVGSVYGQNKPVGEVAPTRKSGMTWQEKEAQRRYGKNWVKPLPKTPIGVRRDFGGVSYNLY